MGHEEDVVIVTECGRTEDGEDREDTGSGTGKTTHGKTGHEGTGHGRTSHRKTGDGEEREATAYDCAGDASRRTYVENTAIFLLLYLSGGITAQVSRDRIL